MSELKWTSERPTKEGGYFYRTSPKHKRELKDVVKSRNDLIARDWQMFRYVCNMPVQWSGPIPEPTEAETPHYVDKATRIDLNERMK